MPRLTLALAAFALAALAPSPRAAAKAADIKALPGFTVEEVYAVPEGQGSWVP